MATGRITSHWMGVPTFVESYETNVLKIFSGLGFYSETSYLSRLHLFCNKTVTNLENNITLHQMWSCEDITETRIQDTPGDIFFYISPL